MKAIRQHRWDVSVEEAERTQEELSHYVIVKDELTEIKKISGVGVTFSTNEDTISVACVNLSCPRLQILDQIVEKRKCDFPYTPGLFAFTVGPVVLSALKKIERPDIIIFPGRGIDHPRRLGLASHLGVLLDVPTIACSKRPLWKKHPDLPREKGGCVFVEDERGEPTGAIVRTKENVKPIYVTTGHKISIQTAVKIILECSSNYRIPEPLRYAHTLAKSRLHAAL